MPLDAGKQGVGDVEGLTKEEKELQLWRHTALRGQQAQGGGAAGAEGEGAAGHKGKGQQLQEGGAAAARRGEGL